MRITRRNHDIVLLMLALGISLPCEAQDNANNKRKLAIAPLPSVVRTPPVMVRRGAVHSSTAPARTVRSSAVLKSTSRSQPAPNSTSAGSRVLTGRKSSSGFPASGSVRGGDLVKASYPATALEKGLYYKQQGRTDEALLAFIRAAQENPRDVRAFYEQAKIFRDKGNVKLAKSALEQALALSPHDMQLRTFLVQVHFESGNLVGAAAEVGKLLNLNQGEKKKEKTVPDNGFRIVTSEAAQIASGKEVVPADKDGTSAWLHSAASPVEAISPAANVGDVLAHIIESNQPDKATMQGPPSQVSQVLSGIPGLPDSKPAAESETNNAPAAAKAESIASANLINAGGSSATNAGQRSASASPVGIRFRPAAVLNWAKDNTQGVRTRTAAVVSWTKDKLPFGQDDKTAPTNDAREQEAGKQTKAQALMSWAKDRLPLAKNTTPETGASNQPAPQAQSSRIESIQSRAASLVTGVKERIPFAHATKPEAAPEEENKLMSFFKDMKERLSIKDAASSMLSVGQKVKLPLPGMNKAPAAPGGQPIVATGPDGEKKQLPPELANAAIKSLQDSKKGGGAKKLKFGMPGGRQNAPVLVTATNPESKSGQSNLPPEIARALQGKFGANAVVTQSLDGHSTKAVSAEDAALRQVLASIPSADSKREIPIAQASGPNYGLLGNNALRHVGASSPVEAAEQKPSLFSSLITQAGKTFSNLIPAVSWSFPSLHDNDRSSNSQSKQADAINAIVANVPVMNADDEAAAAAPAKAPPPIPLDVSRILNKLSSTPPVSPVLTASNPVAPSLSATLPLAASPINIESAIPKPEAMAPAALPAPGGQSGLPAIDPRGLTPNPAGVTGPLSAPQASPLQSNLPQSFGQSPLSPIIQDAVNKVQPIIKPAMDAANNLMQQIAPMVIPHSDSQNVQPVPVPATGAASAENQVPAPVAGGLQKFYQDLTKTIPMAANLTNMAVPIPAPPPPEPAAVQVATAVPKTISGALLPMPLPSLVEQQQAAAVPVPALDQTGLVPSAQTSLPQSVPQTTTLQQPAVPNTLPPVIQQAINTVQPIIKPAVDAANALVQNIAPQVISSAKPQISQPVPQAAAFSPANTVPAPVARTPQAYLAAVTEGVPQPVVGESAGPAHRIIDVQKSKVGAFTYMKPVIDGDRAYLMGGKQIRTIQPLPGKAQEAKKAVQEDPVTRRMRYLLEHGTGNLRKGECFMFSEETGEGTLFMPDGTSERRKLQDPQDAEKVLRSRRPDIINPRDLQYSLRLLGKLLPPQQEQNNDPNAAPMNGPTLEQLMNQMNQTNKGFWGWMKKSFKLQ